MEIARETVVPLIIAFCPEFPWRSDEFIVRDDEWVDLGNHHETAETGQGYFYRECLHLKGKNYVFKTHQFPLYVVVSQGQWDEYLQFVTQQHGPNMATKDSLSMAAKTTRKARSQATNPQSRTSTIISCHHTVSLTCPESNSPPSPTVPLFSEVSGGREHANYSTAKVM